MKIIYQGDPEHFDRAMIVVSREIGRLHVYDRPGWGWHYQSSDYPAATFFVRGIKDGLSVHANSRTAG